MEHRLTVFASLRCPSELGLSSSSSSSSMKVEVLEEGSESTEFIKALGPQDKKAYDCMLKGVSFSYVCHQEHDLFLAGFPSSCFDAFLLESHQQSLKETLKFRDNIQEQQQTRVN